MCASPGAAVYASGYFSYQSFSNPFSKSRDRVLRMKRALPDLFGDDPFADGGDALLASAPCDTEAALRLLNAKLLAWQVREERGEARC